MSQGLLVYLGLMVGVTAFALLTSVSNTAAVAAAGGLLVCAASVRRLEQLPKLGLLVVTALVPLSYLGTRIAVGTFNSFTKLIFIPALAVLAVDRIFTRRPLVLGRQSLYVLLLGLALAISYVLNVRTPDSFWFLTRFASMMLLFFLCANVVRDERDLKTLLVVIAGSCLLSAVGAMITPPPHAGGMSRMTGWAYEDAPTFGTHLLVALLICLYFLFVTRQAWLRVALVPVSGVLALAIVMTYARGVSVVTAVSAAVLLFKLRKRVSVGWVLASVLVLALCLLPLVPGAYWERMSTMVTQYGTDPTINRRADSYRIGLQLFEQHPLLGFGPGNFIAQYMSPEFRFDRSAIPSVCFNLYLSIATQAGLLGLAAFGLIVWSAFRSLRSVARSYGEADGFLKQAVEVLEIVLVALLLISLFEPTDLQKYLWIVFGAAAAAGQIRRAQLAAPSTTPAEAA